MVQNAVCLIQTKMQQKNNQPLTCGQQMNQFESSIWKNNFSEKLYFGEAFTVRARKIFKLQNANKKSPKTQVKQSLIWFGRLLKTNEFENSISYKIKTGKQSLKNSFFKTEVRNILFMTGPKIFATYIWGRPVEVTPSGRFLFELYRLFDKTFNLYEVLMFVNC